jgi:Fibrinogen beta and gamma chains, C-terminal globular domain
LPNITLCFCSACWPWLCTHTGKRTPRGKTAVVLVLALAAAADAQTLGCTFVVSFPYFFCCFLPSSDQPRSPRCPIFLCRAFGSLFLLSILTVSSLAVLTCPDASGPTAFGGDLTATVCQVIPGQQNVYAKASCDQYTPSGTWTVEVYALAGCLGPPAGSITGRSCSCADTTVAGWLALSCTGGGAASCPRGAGTTGAVSSTTGDIWSTYGKSQNESAVSCMDVKTRNPAAASGPYFIALPSAPNASVELYCDMENDGGGWTLVLRSPPSSLVSSNNGLTTGPTAVASLSSMLGGAAKLTDADIRGLRNVTTDEIAYRTTSDPQQNITYFHPGSCDYSHAPLPNPSGPDPCRQFTPTYSATPTYVQCAYFSISASGGIDCWYGCGAASQSTATMTVVTWLRTTPGAGSGINQNPTGAPTPNGNQYKNWGNNVYLWVGGHGGPYGTTGTTGTTKTTGTTGTSGTTRTTGTTRTSGTTGSTGTTGTPASTAAGTTETPSWPVTAGTTGTTGSPTRTGAATADSSSQVGDLGTGGVVAIVLGLVFCLFVVILVAAVLTKKDASSTGRTTNSESPELSSETAGESSSMVDEDS